MKKKILCGLLAAIMLLMAIPAFADTASYITTTSSSGEFVKNNIVRSCTGFSLSGSTSIYTSGSATKLTVRAYKTDNSTKLSNAKTYKAGSLSGGQEYWGTPDRISIKCNNNSGGDRVTVYGTWNF